MLHRDSAAGDALGDVAERCRLVGRTREPFEGAEVNGAGEVSSQEVECSCIRLGIVPSLSLQIDREESKVLLYIWRPYAGCL